MCKYRGHEHSQGTVIGRVNILAVGDGVEPSLFLTVKRQANPLGEVNVFGVPAGCNVPDLNFVEFHLVEGQWMWCPGR